MTIKAQLRAAELRVRAALLQADELRGERDALIALALAEGMSFAAIGRELGVSRERVRQIAAPFGEFAWQPSKRA